MCYESVRGHPLQTYFALAFADDPDNPKLRFDLTHLDVENFANSNLSNHTFDYQTADAHIRYQTWVRKRLAMSIHSPNLYRKLDFDAWADSSIHARIVPHNAQSGNLPGLP